MQANCYGPAHSHSRGCPAGQADAGPPDWLTSMQGTGALTCSQPVPYTCLPRPERAQDWSLDSLIRRHSLSGLGREPLLGDSSSRADRLVWTGQRHSYRSHAGRKMNSLGGKVSACLQSVGRPPTRLFGSETPRDKRGHDGADGSLPRAPPKACALNMRTLGLARKKRSILPSKCSVRVYLDALDGPQ